MAQARRQRSAPWTRARARITAQSKKTRSALRSSSSRRLLGTASFLLALPILPGILTFNYIQDQAALEDRGVHVEAWVVDYRTAGRGSDTVTVRPVEPPYFETDLDRWPRGLDVGDRVHVVFDPHDPGLAVAADAPPVDLSVLVLAAFDLLGLVCLLTALLPVSELLRRIWAQARGDHAPNNERLTKRRPPREHRTHPLARLESGQVVFLLIAAPVSVVLSGLFAADIAGDAAVLQASGIHAQATVEKSDWTAGGHWLDVRFSMPDGAEVSTSITPLDRVYFEGDTLDVVYQPDAPRNVQATGDAGWQVQAQIAVGLLVVCATGAAVAVPVAVVDLVHRARRARTASVPIAKPTAG